MKLLISAYACAPNRGSEHGSAWNWTSEVARLGHEVTVLVSPAHRNAILAATEEDRALQRIRWLFPEVVIGHSNKAKNRSGSEHTICCGSGKRFGSPGGCTASAVRPRASFDLGGRAGADLSWGAGRAADHRSRRRWRNISRKVA